MKTSSAVSLISFMLVSLTGLTATPATAQIDPGMLPVADQGMLPVAGTWVRGGHDTVAWFDLDTWHLVTSVEGTPPVAPLDPEPQPWYPVAGDWDGDGVDSIQMFNVYDWRLVPAERGVQSDSSEPQPVPWVPVAGDWGGNGIDTVLVFDRRDGSLHRLEEGPIRVERYDPEPQPWHPVAGDWDGDGVDTLATYRNEETVPAPAPVWATVTGDWDGDGIDTAAAFHMPSGRLVVPEQERLSFSSMTMASPAPPLGRAPNGPGPCFKTIKNKHSTAHVFHDQMGGCFMIIITTWEEWTCCPITANGWSYACGMQLKFSGSSGGC